MSSRSLALLLAALLVPACAAKGALFLTIEAQKAGQTMKIPDDVDDLQVRVTSTDGKTEVFSKSYSLTREQFPLTLGLQAGAHTPAEIRVVATLSKGDTPVAGAEAVATISHGELTTITLRVVSE